MTHETSNLKQHVMLNAVKSEVLIMKIYLHYFAVAPAGAAVFGEETVALSVALRTMLSSSLEAKD